MKNHQVKIKINGKERPYQHGKKNKKHDYFREKKPPVPPKVEKSPTFPLDEDLPLIIVDESAAAAEKKEEEEFEWVLPKEPKKQEKPERKKTSPKASYIEDLRQMNDSKKGQATPFGKKKIPKSPSFYKQLLLSIGMAIGIGTCLGFLILAIMKIPDSPLNPDVPATATVTPENGANENATNAGGTDSFTIPAQTVSVLQAGAFTTSDGATAEINRLQGAGFAATSVGSDPTYVLMAVGQSVDGMKIVGAEAASKGFEQTYAKDLTLPGKTLESLSSQDVALLEEGQSLYVQLVTATSMLLEGMSVDAATTDGLQGSMQKVEAINSSDLTEATSGYKAALVSAYESLQAYQSSNNKEALWAAQQKLLDATSFLY